MCIWVGPAPAWGCPLSSYALPLVSGQVGRKAKREVRSVHRSSLKGQEQGHCGVGLELVILVQAQGGGHGRGHVHAGLQLVVAQQVGKQPLGKEGEAVEGMGGCICREDVALEHAQRRVHAIHQTAQAPGMQRAGCAQQVGKQALCTHAMCG